MATTKQAKVTDEHREEAARLRAIWDKTPHPNQADFGEQYHIGNQSAVGHFLNARTPLSLKAASGFSIGLGVPIADFSPRLAVFSTALNAKSVQPALFPSPESTITAPEKISESKTPNYPDNTVHIDQWNTGGAMGYGFTLPEEAGVIRRWSVDETWVQANIHRITSVHNLAIVTGFGDSMLGMYNPGDPLMLDRGVKRVDIDGVYFFRVDDEGFIKRLQRIPTEKGLILRATSENPKYQPFDITKKMNFELFGRIIKVWEGTEF